MAEGQYAIENADYERGVSALNQAIAKDPEFNLNSRSELVELYLRACVKSLNGNFGCEQLQSLGTEITVDEPETAACAGSQHWPGIDIDDDEK